jgi:hypothetical protein
VAATAPRTVLAAAATRDAGGGEGRVFAAFGRFAVLDAAARTAALLRAAFFAVVLFGRRVAVFLAVPLADRPAFALFFTDPARAVPFRFAISGSPQGTI